MSLQPIYVAGSSVGLENDKKPFLLTEQAFQYLNNGYVWRERVKKREALRLLGRLRRFFTDFSLGNSGASPWTFNIYATIVPAIIPEANAEIDAGAVTITIGAIVFSDFVKSGAITAATNADPCQITSANHRLTTGDYITITLVTGMTELNGGSFQITVVDANNFTLDNTDSTNFGVYTGGGQWDTVTAQGNGFLVSPTAGNSGIINYLTGDVTLTHTAGAGIATTITFGYFPALPVMGIFVRDISNVNDEETIFFDTKYAYRFVGGGFQEVVINTVWDGSDSDFFWCTNYRGVTNDIRLFFVTNDFNSATVPMRYFDSAACFSFTPGIAGATPTTADTTFLLQARILIPYYGRLLALNTTEGAALGGGVNFFNRCRFSQVGDPTQATVVGPPFVGGAWRSDVFGKGGFIDAPTNEAIISAAFVKNTLIVFFERSTWQLRYVGEYGLPFLWERISSDLGCESTNSPIIFNDGALAVGDKAIISANAVGVERIDLKIPDFVFNIRNAQNGVDRVVGIRDFPKELVYWCCSDSELQRKFPNQVLLYNYRNNTWALFRDNVTFFGTFQPELAITWGRFDIFWKSMEITWADVETQEQFPFVVSGNQQGFIHFYMDNTVDEESLAISAINVGVTPVQLTVANHNLETGETIYITDILYDTSTDLNDRIYSVVRIDDNTIALQEWDFTNEVYVDVTSVSVGTYTGKGRIALFPILYLQTKDFNPFEQQGQQMKLAYIDFQTDATPSSAVTVQLFINGAQADLQANLIVGNKNVETSLPTPYYPQVSSQYAWHRFFATMAAQYVSFAITYDNNLKNTLETFEQDFQLNAFTLWVRPGGKNIF